MGGRKFGDGHHRQARAFRVGDRTTHSTEPTDDHMSGGSNVRQRFVGDAITPL
jgi:hypothetical protein